MVRNSVKVRIVYYHRKVVESKPEHPFNNLLLYLIKGWFCMFQIIFVGNGSFLYLSKKNQHTSRSVTTETLCQLKKEIDFRRSEFQSKQVGRG